MNLVKLLTVTTRAGSASEGDVGSGIDGEAVVLVLDIGARDVDTGGAADIKSVGVVAKSVSVRVQFITSAVVDGHVLDVDVLSTVDREALHWGVLDVEPLNGGVGHVVSVKELWLGGTAIATLTVPPLGTVAVNDMSRGSSDGDAGTGESDERALPLVVLEGRCALELNVGAVVQVRQVESLSSWDSDVLEHNVGA